MADALRPFPDAPSANEVTQARRSGACAAAHLPSHCFGWMVGGHLQSRIGRALRVIPRRVAASAGTVCRFRVVAARTGSRREIPTGAGVLAPAIARRSGGTG